MALLPLDHLRRQKATYFSVFFFCETQYRIDLVAGNARCDRETRSNCPAGRVNVKQAVQYGGCTVLASGKGQPTGKVR